LGDKYRIELSRRGQSTLEHEIKILRTDDRGRPHSLDQPAVEWEDGFKCWFIEGVLFDPKTWEAIVTRTQPAKEAINLTNVEQRRIAINRIGVEKLLDELKALAMEIWHGYALYGIQLYDDIELIDAHRTEKQQKYFGRFDKHFLEARFLKMRDSTTGATYFLRVPPETHTCLEAVAWTFNQNPMNYRPEKET
jgi:hypothetical protein